jgi:hypothetical protein
MTSPYPPAPLEARPVERRGDSRVPDRSPSPGLYDLPALLARIWSVPAARLATSGSYSTAPAPPPPTPPGAALDRSPADPREGPPNGPDPWPFLPHREVPSLPSTGVLPLSLIPAFRAPGAVPSSRRGRRTEEGIVYPATRYLAWKHPPCHLAIEPRLSIEAQRLKGIGDARPNLAGPASALGEPWSRHELLIRPASLPLPRPRYGPWAALGTPAGGPISPFLVRRDLFQGVVGPEPRTRE